MTSRSHHLPPPCPSAATRRSFLTAVAAGLGVTACAHLKGAAAPDASDDALRRTLDERVNRQKQSLAIAVGIVSPRGRRTMSCGRLSAADPRAPNEDTVFEIGSVTKVFTNLVFADMVRRGQIGLDDPLSMFLPAGTRLPEWNGRRITLLDLATHTSGLPSFPPNLGRPEYDTTPSYSLKNLFDFLSDFRLPRAPGEGWQYSNLGTSLLGMAIANKAGVAYETLVRERVLSPLRLHDTDFVPSRSMNRRAATGHEGDLQPAPRWELGLFRPGGGLLSTVNDMMTFLSETLLRDDSPLAQSTKLMIGTRRLAPQEPGDQAMGWEILQIAGRPLLSKGGLMRGQTAAVVFDQASHTGAVVLSNSNRPISDIARHILRPSYPLMRSFTAVRVRPEVLDQYVGSYRTSLGTMVSVTRLGDGIALQSPPGGPEVLLTAASDTVFVAFTVEFEFRRGDSRAVENVLIRRPGQPEVTAVRVR